MAYSSILGAEVAPAHPSGRGADLLGPSDLSDSGSDSIGTDAALDDTDSTGTGARGAVAGTDAREGSDIMPDRIVDMAEGEGLPEAELEGMDMTDIDDDEIAGLAGDETEGDPR